jgi:hypothetical protein
MTEQEKLDHLSKNFGLLNKQGQNYLRQVARQLLYVQYPAVLPSAPQKRKYRKREKEE